MSQPHRPPPEHAADPVGGLRERLEVPMRRVGRVTRWTLERLPVRVWRHFLARNGFLLSAGLSYQALFAIFAALYVAFAVGGIWLTGNAETLDAFVLLLNAYAPGLIGEAGLVSTEDLTAVAASSGSLFGVTGAFALGGLVWTAVAWITYARLAVRSIFGLPRDDRAYLLLKARDLIAGFAFGTTVVVATVLSVVGTWLFGWLLALFGLSDAAGWSDTLVQAGALIVVFAIDALALAVLFRFLSGATMPWRRMWIGSLLGSAGLTVLQLLGGLVIAGAGRNPLVATFAVFIALLLWFRLASIVLLVAASWIAVEASDHREPLRRVTPEQLRAEEREREQRALVTAARVGVREARRALDEAGPLARFGARRRLERAERELDRAEASLAATARRDVGGLP